MSEVARAVGVLAAGGLLGLPTETVYGLAADGENPEALAGIFAVKGRPTEHPLILHLAEASWLDRYCVNVPEMAWTLARAYWPGPLSLILSRSALVPDAVTGGRDTVAVRVPGHPLALAVLQAFGRALAAPSANRFGAVSPTTAEHVRHDLGQEVAFVLDGGECEVGLESTILDLTRGQPRLLRPGGISPEEISVLLGVEVLLDDGKGPAAPGTLASHYSPQARVRLVSAEELAPVAHELVTAGRKVGVLVHGGKESLPDACILRDVGEREESTAHELYAALRALDELGCSDILTTLPSLHGIGRAVADRLTRAAAEKPR